jgi:type VI secretion system protein ImpK
MFTQVAIMRDHAADLVHSVLEYGLELRDRIEGEGAVHLDKEQGVLKTKLLMDRQSESDLEFANASSTNQRIPTKDEATLYRIRYMLTCWLDELFIRYSPWADAWTQRKLEVALYSTSDGNWKFWQHVQQAEAESDNDALEVCHLCVMLGFRGQRADETEKLRDWLAATAERLAGQRRPWQLPAALEPPTHVPPLQGRERLRRMILVSGLTAVVLVPFVAFLLAREF